MDITIVRHLCSTWNIRLRLKVLIAIVVIIQIPSLRRLTRWFFEVFFVLLIVHSEVLVRIQANVIHRLLFNWWLFFEDSIKDVLTIWPGSSLSIRRLLSHSWRIRLNSTDVKHSIERLIYFRGFPWTVFHVSLHSWSSGWQSRRLLIKLRRNNLRLILGIVLIGCWVVVHEILLFGSLSHLKAIRHIQRWIHTHIVLIL